jgi:predicted dehydrogenase
MTRIFMVLAATDTLLLLLSYGFGVVSKLRHGVDDPNDPTFWYHFLLGLTAAMLTLFVHCLIFTYFLGTGRWVKEVKLAYNLPDQPLAKLTRELKRRVFPPALFAMLAAIATGAAGAAAQVKLAPWEVHGTLGTLTLFINLWAFGIEIQCLRTNGWVLEEVMREVDRLRARRGLPSNAEALEQEAAP